MTTPFHNLPTPGDMIDLEASELAILAALDATLEATVAAMLVANLEVLHADPHDDYESHSPQVWIAEALVAQARALRTTIDRYRRTVYRRTREDEDIDF